MLNRRGYWWILLAIAFAVLLGSKQPLAFVTSVIGFNIQPFFLKGAFLISEMFVRLLKLISLPIISLSLLATISSVSEKSLSGMGKRIVSYTILTTMIAAVIALFLYLVINPVLGANTMVTPITGEAPSYIDAFLKMIPSNLVQPFLEGNVVSILLLSLLFGFGIAHLPIAQRLPLHQLLQSLFQIMMLVTRWIVALMPIAIWGFMTTFVAELSQGLDIHQVGWYLVTVLSANLIQGVIVLPLFLLWHGLSPIKAFSQMLPAISFAFFSKSSAAALPSAIDCAERKLNVSPDVSRFSFPLCTTINMNACAAFILITVLFVAQSSGLHFTMIEKLTWVLIATVAAIGNAGVPMGCFFIASALLTTLNLPLTLMGIILPFYAILDMLESAINIWSDACVTLVVDQKSKALVEYAS